MSQTSIGSLLLLLWAGAVGAAAVEYKQQAITVPSDQGGWLTPYLADIDGDGRTDLLVLLPAQRELLVYRQRQSGFTATADQTVALPDQTAWVAMRDVDPHEGKELVISTATGLVYLRQDQGAFDPSPRMLIEARQVFMADRLRITSSPPGGPYLKEALPVVFEDYVALYEKNSDDTWSVTRTAGLSPMEPTWQAREEYWMTGPAPAFSLEVRRAIRARPQDGRVQKAEAEKKATQELIGRLTKEARWDRYVVRHQDVNGDGREDLVLWRSQGDVSPRTTILLLLREQDGRLPERPTRVLRHSGLPICVGRQRDGSPFWDLDGDGRCELILVALKTRVTSWSSMVNMVVSGGVEWVFTVRSGRDGTYAGNPDFQMDVTSMPPRSASVSSLFSLNGDFNGDGRTDLLVERGPEQFDVYLSAPGAKFFQAGPALSFAAPIEARMVSTADLNSDGLSDFFVQKATEARLTVCLSQSAPRKGPSK
jgi:hypothetical protein